MLLFFVVFLCFSSFLLFSIPVFPSSLFPLVTFGKQRVVLSCAAVSVFSHPVNYLSSAAVSFAAVSFAAAFLSFKFPDSCWFFLSLINSLSPTAFLLPSSHWATLTIFAGARNSFLHEGFCSLRLAVKIVSGIVSFRSFFHCDHSDFSTDFNSCGIVYAANFVVSVLTRVFSFLFRLFLSACLFHRSPDLFIFSCRSGFWNFFCSPGRNG